MSIAENYLYNVIYQIVAMIIPFITVPYVSRVLGAEAIGINAFTGSILQYFSLFGSLGIGLYANRTIAYVRDNKKRLSKTFWSIFSLQFILCNLSFVLYIIFVIYFTNSFKLIYFLHSFNLLAIALDISWLFVGLEDFKTLVWRSIFFKILGVVCIFFFIKNSADLWKYTAISSLSALLGQMVLWLHLHKLVEKTNLRFKDVIKHIKPSIQLFIPQIAIQIYLVLNKTMLGIFSNNREVGLYENSDRIIKMTLALITATGGVMLPRVANSFAKGDKEKVNYYVYGTLNFISYLSIPMMFGMIAISNKFIPWFLGSDFNKSSIIIIILSPIIVSIAWSNVLGFQYMIPTGRSNELTISVSLGAFINLILNFILIKKFYATGAAIATVIAEITVTLSQIYLLRKVINILNIYKEIVLYFISSAVMFLTISLLGNHLEASLKTTFLQISIGIAVYITSLFILKSEMNLYIFKKIFKKLYHMLLSKETGL